MELIEKYKVVDIITRLINEVNPTKDKVGITGCANTVKYLEKALSEVDKLEITDIL